MENIELLIEELKKYFSSSKSEREKFIQSTFLGLPDDPSRQSISPRQIKLFGSQTQIQLYDWMVNYNASIYDLFVAVKNAMFELAKSNLYRKNFTFSLTTDGNSVYGSTTKPIVDELLEYVDYEHNKSMTLSFIINDIKKDYIVGNIRRNVIANTLLIEAIGIENTLQLETMALSIDLSKYGSNDNEFEILGQRILQLTTTQLDTYKKEIQEEFKKYVKYDDILYNKTTGEVVLPYGKEFVEEQNPTK